MAKKEFFSSPILAPEQLCQFKPPNRGWKVVLVNREVTIPLLSNVEKTKKLLKTGLSLTDLSCFEAYTKNNV
jgi:hypothetical protein